MNQYMSSFNTSLFILFVFFNSIGYAGNDIGYSLENKNLSDINHELESKINIGLNSDFEKGMNAYQSENFKLAINVFKKIAEQGHVDAQYYLAKMYESGQGIKQDNKIAKEWYQKAAENGHDVAQFWLGSLYLGNNEIEPNYKMVLKWYKISSEQGNVEAQNNLGMMYLNGIGVEEDDDLGVRWIKKSAKQGHAIAQNNLGSVYKKGLDVDVNYALAAYWYQKASEQGDMAAQHELGIMYHNGEGITQNDERAMYWYKKSAKQGYVDAQVYLGYLNLTAYGVKQDLKEAAYWYQEAADQGDGRAEYRLARMYHKGEGMQQDNKEAFRWYQLAAEQGHMDAQYHLGNMHYSGHGIEQNFKFAAELYHESIEKKSMDNIDRQIMNSYQSAAEKGDADAQYNLAMIYYNGEGIFQDYEQAAFWFQKVIERNGPVEVDDKNSMIDKMEFIHIPSGCYEVVNNNGRPEYETCFTKGYEMGKYEVTQGIWQAIMGSNPSYFTSSNNHPVEGVSWNEVQNFIERINKLTKKKYRLPIAEEWEYACQSNVKNIKHCGGHSIDDVAWHYENSENKTHRVGQKQPNSFGLYDMNGNVSEWVQSWYEDNFNSADLAEHNNGTFEKKYHASRGSSWLHNTRHINNMSRSWHDLSHARHNLGFRLVRTD